MIPRILLTLVTIVFILLCNVACNDVDRGTQKRVGIINDLTGLKTVIEMDVIDNLYTNSTTFIGECQPNIKTNSGFRMLQREIEHLWINPGLSNWIASANLKANT